MRERAKSAKRVLKVQTLLHERSELAYLKATQRLEGLRADEVELVSAMSGDSALHGLFVDITVKRLASIREEAKRAELAVEEASREVLKQGGRIRNIKRLVEDLDTQVRRADERTELDQILEITLVKDRARFKQDP